MWGALAQVLLVFGIAETMLGRRRTLLIAYVRTPAGALHAHIGVTTGPDGVLGLPAADAQAVDTGPSWPARSAPAPGGRGSPSGPRGKRRAAPAGLTSAK